MNKELDELRDALAAFGRALLDTPAGRALTRLVARLAVWLDKIPPIDTALTTKECEICGKHSARACCGRCDDRSCNAGCIYCRPRDEWDSVTLTMNEHPVFALYCMLAILYAAYRFGRP